MDCKIVCVISRVCDSLCAFSFAYQGMSGEFSDAKHIILDSQSWTTKRVLVMEFIEGCKVNDLHRLEEMGIDRTEVSQLLTEVFSEMIFVQGFFHGVCMCVYVYAPLSPLICKGTITWVMYFVSCLCVCAHIPFRSLIKSTTSTRFVFHLCNLFCETICVIQRCTHVVFLGVGRGLHTADPHPGNIMIRPSRRGTHPFEMVILDHGLYRSTDTLPFLCIPTSSSPRPLCDSEDLSPIRSATPQATYG